MQTPLEDPASVQFTLLTPRSLKRVLGDAEERSIQARDPDLKAGNQLPAKYFYSPQFSPSEDLTCVPLEEIDPAYHNLKTFTVIGRYGTIYRYSAQTSLATFSALNPVRSWTIFLTTHWAFSLFMATVVALNTALLIGGSERSSRTFDLISVGIYGIEMLLKVVSEGLVRDPFTYLRRPWNYMDILVLLTCTVKSFKAFPMLYWARVLKIVQLVPEIRRSFKLFLSSVLQLRRVLPLGSFLVLILALLGKVGFLGVFTRRCVSASDYWEQLSLMGEEDVNNTSSESQSGTGTVAIASWRDFASNKSNWYSQDECEDGEMGTGRNKYGLLRCPEEENYECIPGVGANPDYGMTNFDSISWSIMQTVRIVDQDFLENIYIKLSIATGAPGMTTVYFIAAFFFGTYALGTLAYAVLGSFLLPLLQKRSEDQNYKRVRAEDSENAVDRILKRRPSTKDPVLFFVHDLLTSVYFELFITGVIFLDIIALSVAHHNMSYFVTSFTKWTPWAVMVVYTIEFIIKIYFFGVREYFKKGWNVFDFVLLVDLYLQVWVKKYGLALPIRIFKLTPRWGTLSLVLRIAFESVKWLWGIGGLLVSLGVYCALVGMGQFGESYLSETLLFDTGLFSLPRWSFIDFWHASMVVFRSWIGESIEVLSECQRLAMDGGWQCFAYFGTVAFTGALTLMILTIGIVFVSDSLISHRMNTRVLGEASVLAKVFCFPCVWLKKQKALGEAQTRAEEPEEEEETSVYGSRIPEAGSRSKKRMIFCSPPAGGSKVLKGVAIFLISVFSIVLTMDNVPNETDIDTTSLVFAVDVVFTVFTSATIVYRLVILGGKYCVTHCGWLFDLCVVLEMIVNLLYNLHPELNPYPKLYFFRSLRPFMLVCRVETLEIVLRGIAQELRFLWKFILAGAFVWLHFVIMGTKMFGGAFSKCIDNEDGTFVNSTMAPSRKACLSLNHTRWENSDLNFDHLGNSFISLALIGKRNSWVTILYDSTDFHAAHMNFQREYDLNNVYFFLAFFVCGIFFVVNIVLGAAYCNLRQFTGLFLTTDQMEAERKSDRRKHCCQEDGETSLYPRPKGDYRGKVYNFVTNQYFEALVLTVIAGDMLLFSIVDTEMKYWDQEGGIDRVYFARNAILCLYILEAVLKVLAWGKPYFYQGRNQFDIFLIVNASIEVYNMELGFSPLVNPDILRILRIARIFSYHPIMSRASLIRQFFRAFSRFARPFRNILIFHAFIMYSYALIGVKKFGHVKLSKGLDEYFNFQTVPSSLKVLFMLSSMVGVEGILPAITQEVDCTPDSVITVPSPLDNYTYYTEFLQGDCGDDFWGTIYVFSYVLLSFITFANLYMMLIFEIMNARGDQPKDKDKEKEVQKGEQEGCWENSMI